MRECNARHNAWQKRHTIYFICIEYRNGFLMYFGCASVLQSIVTSVPAGAPTSWFGTNIIGETGVTTSCAEGEIAQNRNTNIKSRERNDNKKKYIRISDDNMFVFSHRIMFHSMSIFVVDLLLLFRFRCWRVVTQREAFSVLVSVYPPRVRCEPESSQSKRGYRH